MRSHLVCFKFMYHLLGWDSTVVIVTCYRVDGPEIDPGGGRHFPHLPRPALWTNQPPVKWVPGLSRG